MAGRVLPPCGIAAGTAGEAEAAGPAASGGATLERSGRRIPMMVDMESEAPLGVSDATPVGGVAGRGAAGAGAAVAAPDLAGSTVSRFWQ